MNIFYQINGLYATSQKGQEADNPRFIATFDGPSNGNGNFELSGEAKGASLAIADRYGRQAIPGQPLPPVGMIRSQWHCCTKLE